MNLLVVVAALGLGAAAGSLERVRPVALATPTSECQGCKSGAFDDPNQSIVAGIQVLQLDPGMTLTGSLVIRSHGSCLMVLHQGAWECSPDRNCAFSASYIARDDGTNGQFRNDVTPYCEWSIPSSPGQTETVMTSLESTYPPWISQCGASTWQTVRFLRNAADCFTGVVCAAVKFHATFGVCPP
jgi:hypothetical protein